MSTKNFTLTVLVLVLALTASALAQPTVYGGRRSFWSDQGPGHNWSEPNNWWTVDFYFTDDNNDGGWDFNPVLEDKWYVKVHPNQVPDINITAYIGKGELRVDYPPELNYVMTDPTIDSGTFDTNYVNLGGGMSSVSTPDPNYHHYLTVTGGTLNIGTPIDGGYWYRWWYDWEYNWLGDGPGAVFGGQYAGSTLRIGIIDQGSGTMYMSDGVVNIGGHIEVGGWGGTGELTMDGGTINIANGFYCPGSIYGSVGNVYLNGGTINADYMELPTVAYWDPQGNANAWATVDFAGGKMELTGDESELILDYADPNEAPAGVTVTVYGVTSGSIASGGTPADGNRVVLNAAYGADGNTTVEAVLTHPDQAYSPWPADTQAEIRGPTTDVALPMLIWTPGDGTTISPSFAKQDVYLGTSFAEVNDADNGDPNVYMGWQDDADPNYVPASDLKSFTTYYWRVDSTNQNQSQIIKGKVWSFKIADLEKASYPVPADWATNVFPFELTWTEGLSAVSHNVYFSSEFNDVNERDPNFMTNVGTAVFPVSGLTFNTTYYWRVDEVNGAPYPGDVWRFTITDHINVDDMEGYDTTINLISEVWEDYFYNDTLAELTTDNSIGYYPSEQSMVYEWRNAYYTQGGKTYNGSHYSEANAVVTDLEIGSDWTKGGAEALVIHFFGQADNIPEPNNQMYIALEDGTGNIAVKYYPIGDMTDLQDEAWTQWNIALTDFNDINNVDVTNVSRVYIGFGQRGTPKPGAGTIGDHRGRLYIDEIEVWPRRCVPSVSLPYGDFTGAGGEDGDCTVDNWDVEFMAAEWLISDYNLIGFKGELINFPEDPNDPNYDACWVGGYPTDPNDSGLLFGYEHPRDLNDWPISDDYAKFPPLNLNSNTITFTAWVKRNGLQRDDAAIFYCDGQFGEWPGETVAGFNVGIGTDNSLGYNWPVSKGWVWQWDPEISVLPHQEWAFCALTIAPDEATIYIQLPDLPRNLESDKNIAGGQWTHLPCGFEIPSTIGMHKGRHFDGVIDDVRIYDYTLSYDNIDYIASDGGSGVAPPTSPFIWYKFNDGTGLIAEDSGVGGVIYFENPSSANLYEDEAPYYRYVNFKDFSVMADNWLADLQFPIP
ncbi:MAG: LamG domain-containing protein [Planctomycetota bacterium]|jgi:hypothetical protein